jgi:spermidine synthase
MFPESGRNSGGGFGFPALALAFAASGVSALIDQTVWQRMLGIFAGSDAVTAAIVVGAFLLGLGLGSLAAGLFADRLGPARAAYAFAACEVGIGLFALLSKPFLYDFVALRLGPWVDNRPLIFLLCFAGLLLPTFLMGCSLPLLARAAVTGLAGAARRIGFLYGVNTAGAGLGALFGGWWLIGTFGFEAALWVAAGLNGIAALLAIAVARGLTAGPEAPIKSAPFRQGEAERGLILGWSVLVFVSGFIIVGLEIMWVRLLGTFFQSSAYAFSSILAIFLLADGLGIVAGARLVDRLARPRTSFVLVQALAVAVAALSLALVHAGLAWFGLDSLVGADMDRHRGPGLVAALLLAVAVVAPPSFLMGLSFPFVQKAIQRDFATVGRRVGLVQLCNIVGNAAGSLCVGLLALEYLGTVGTMIALGMLAVGLVADEWRRAVGGPRTALVAGGAGVVTLLAILPSNAAYWHAGHGVGPANEAYFAEGRSGVALLRLTDGQGPMFIGGFSQSHVPFASWHVLLGVLGPLVHPDPREILVIGVGAGGTPYSAGISPATRHIRAIELVRPVYDVLDQYAAAHSESAVAQMRRDPRYTWVYGDGRHDIFVGHRRFDVIQADAILPESSMSGTLYSREFFETARAALSENGIFVQWSPTRRTIDTFVSVFPHVVKVEPFPALIGSNRPIPFTPAAIAERLRAASHREHIRTAGVDSLSLIPLVTGAPRVWTPESARGGEINTDLHPRDEYYLNGRRTRLY